MEAFVNSTGVGVFPNIEDLSGEVWVDYSIGTQPAFVFQRADGSIEKFGSLGGDALQENIDRIFG